MAELSRTDLKWIRSINIDTLDAVSKVTIFHPFVAWIIVLSLRALLYPPHSWEWQAAVVYASFLTILHVILYINDRIAYGLPRDVFSLPYGPENPEMKDEVVVITGGTHGLGRLIAETYDLSGTTVAILDTEEPSDLGGSGNITFYKCDVGDRSALAIVAKEIRENLGTPTILINNAGVMHGKPLLELSYDEIETSVSTNLLSHFYTIKEFLPGMISYGGGTIVTVASVIGHLGAAGLTDYAATKSALLTLHSSLTAELAQSPDPGAQNIRTILCAPGQLNTRMFQHVQSPSLFFAPIVEPTKVATAIIKMVNSGMSGRITLPLYATWAPILNALPVAFHKIARSVSGIDTAIAKAAAAKKADTKGKKEL